jgi:hypothetical protein
MYWHFDSRTQSIYADFDQSKDVQVNTVYINNGQVEVEQFKAVYAIHAKLWTRYWDVIAWKDFPYRFLKAGNMEG